MNGTFDRKLRVELEELTVGMCRALGDAKRLMILYALADGSRSVNELAELLDVAQANVSQHLAVLRDRGLVDTERAGNHVIYALRDRRVVEAVDLLRAIMGDELDRRRAIRTGR